jgi:pilus assembly protein Flp/PilA
LAAVSLISGRIYVEKGAFAMKNLCSRFLKETRGQDLVEYALAAGLVAVAAVAAMPALTSTVQNVFTKIGSIINAVVI